MKQHGKPVPRGCMTYDKSFLFLACVRGQILCCRLCNWIVFLKKSLKKIKIIVKRKISVCGQDNEKFPVWNANLQTLIPFLTSLFFNLIDYYIVLKIILRAHKDR